MKTMMKFAVLLAVLGFCSIPSKAAVVSAAAATSTATLVAATSGQSLYVESCVVSASTNSAVQFILLANDTESDYLPRLSAAQSTSVLIDFRDYFGERLYVPSGYALKVKALGADANAKITCSVKLEKKFQ